jgi:erythromycin esterase-like protein
MITQDIYNSKGYILLTCFIMIFFGCKPRQQHLITANNTSKDTIRLQLPSHKLENAKDLDALLAAIGDAKVVLLGEATHGTHEFYTWRTLISQRLIQEKGFDFIAVEGEWADSYRVNKYIKGIQQDTAATVKLLQQYNRWPTWMWGNHETASLVQWLNNYNQGKDAKAKIGFYGLDVYCLWESMAEIMPYLPHTHSTLQQAAQKVHQCFQPYSADAVEYARAVMNTEATCRQETSRLWNTVEKLATSPALDDESRFVIQQNALVAYNGERYYRSMATDDNESWNIRDRHMAQTLRRLMDFHGSEAKAIVWEHNTHVGDARYTDMAQAGQTNVGELARKEYGENKVFIVGFGTYSGTVVAAQQWGAPYQVMNIPPAQAGSWEDLLHKTGPHNRLLLSKELQGLNFLKNRIGHRAIGVVYHPHREQYGNYVPSILPNRYDAFIFIDRTKALHPIQTKVNNEPPDTYPSGY